MSKQHPIISVTGSSGSGTSKIKKAFTRLFQREQIHPAIIQGDSFHRYDRDTMERLTEEARQQGQRLTHFGPEGNHFDKLETLFKEYSTSGKGQKRQYIHDEQTAMRYQSPVGTLTEWECIESDTDLLFYEGLHGGLVTDTVNIPHYVDLLIGVVPIINLEWIQKIHRDEAVRGYNKEEAIDMILSRMYDYVHYITPQFSRTDINFQRVPTIDTSNPFETDVIPSDEESFSVIHIRNCKKIDVDFPFLLDVLEGSFMSTPDTIVVPASKKVMAIQLLFEPVLRRLTQRE